MLPLASTTVTVLRSNQPSDAAPDVELRYRVLAFGVRAHPFKLSRSASSQPGTQRMQLPLHMLLDPLPGNVELTHFDLILDESFPDSAPYRSTWIIHRFPGSILEHWVLQADKQEFEQAFDLPLVLLREQSEQ